jgi:hypothetical protein
MNSWEGLEESGYDPNIRYYLSIYLDEQRKLIKKEPNPGSA